MSEKTRQHIQDKSKQDGLACKVAIALIQFYKFAISPFLAGCCRFEPTCSTYSMQAFKKYGFWKGLKLTVKRISRCRPGGSHGYDPVP